MNTSHARYINFRTFKFHLLNRKNIHCGSHKYFFYRMDSSYSCFSAERHHSSDGRLGWCMHERVDTKLLTLNLIGSLHLELQTLWIFWSGILRTWKFGRWSVHSRCILCSSKAPCLIKTVLLLIVSNLTESWAHTEGLILKEIARNWFDDIKLSFSIVLFK